MQVDLYHNIPPKPNRPPHAAVPLPRHNRQRLIHFPHPTRSPVHQPLPPRLQSPLRLFILRSLQQRPSTLLDPHRPQKETLLDWPVDLDAGGRG